MRATLDGRWQSVEHLGPSEESVEPIEMEVPISHSSKNDNQILLAELSSEPPHTINKAREPPQRPIQSQMKLDAAALDWKPVTMRWMYLGLLAAICLSLAILQELLYRYSHKHNGVLNFQSTSDLSSGQVCSSACCNYLGY